MWQWQYHSEYKKHYNFKLQGVITSDSLCISIRGPFAGEINDNNIIYKIMLVLLLKQVSSQHFSLHLLIYESDI